MLAVCLLFKQDMCGYTNRTGISHSTVFTSVARKWLLALPMQLERIWNEGVSRPCASIWNQRMDIRRQRGVRPLGSGLNFGFSSTAQSKTLIPIHSIRAPSLGPCVCIAQEIPSDV